VASVTTTEEFLIADFGLLICSAAPGLLPARKRRQTMNQQS
jgi:hypothetical protein